MLVLFHNDNSGVALKDFAGAVTLTMTVGLLLCSKWQVFKMVDWRSSMAIKMSLC